MAWTEVSIAVGTGLVRSVIGWLENAIQDGKITLPEWALLGSTIFRVGLLTLASYYGLNLDIIQASGVAILTDFGIHAVKKAGSKK